MTQTNRNNPTKSFSQSSNSTSTPTERSVSNQEQQPITPNLNIAQENVSYLPYPTFNQQMPQIQNGMFMPHQMAHMDNPYIGPPNMWINPTQMYQVNPRIPNIHQLMNNGYNNINPDSTRGMDPREIPLPESISNRHSISRPPSVVSVMSNSTMSTRSQKLKSPPNNHQHQDTSSNAQQAAMVQALLENQRIIQEMQHQLKVLSTENSFLKQQRHQHQDDQIDDVVSLSNSTAATQQQQAFYEQMIAASKAQQAFFQKSDISSTNLKFPKFSGKSTTEFVTWYDQVLSILAIPPWQSLYDKTTNRVIQENEAKESLSMKLYSSLKLCVQGQAQTIMNTKTHLRGRGLEYLKTLHTIYKKKLTKVEMINKESEYNNLYRLQDENLDAFAARCIFLHQELKDNGSFANRDGLRTRFIRGLGPDFSDVQKLLDNLPPEWDTLNIEELLTVARNHLNNILAIRSNNKQHKEQNKPKVEKEPEAKGGQEKPKPKPKAKKPPHTENQTQNTNPDASFKSRQMNPDIREFLKKNEERQARIETDMSRGVFSYDKYYPEIKKGFCVWHNSKYHTSQYCEVVNALLHKYPNQSKMESTCIPVAKHTSTNLSQQPRDTTDMEDIDLSALEQATDELMNFNNNLNSNKNNVSNYFKISCNHVHIQKHVNLKNDNNNKSNIEFVIDSGAYPHMCNNARAFSTYTEWPKNHTIKYVSLADDSKAPIMGIGTIECKINENKYTIKGVLFVPSLTTSLFSVKQHCEKPGQLIHFDNDKVTIAFPTFIATVQIKDEIILPIQICKNVKRQMPFDNETPTYNINDKMKISYKPLSNKAITPSKSTKGSAAFDIYASSHQIIPPNARLAIKTDISLAIPFGYYGRIAARSGLTIKNNIDIGAGVIDSDYRGEIKPILINNSTKPFQISQHDRIAQIIIEQCADVTFQQVEELTETQRGTKGFGSSDEPHAKRVLPLIQNRPVKVTIKLPWSEEFTKGHLFVDEINSTFTSLSEEQHILPTKSVDKMRQKEQILLGHHHKISNTPRTNTPLRLVDKPIQNAPHVATMSVDQMRKGFGFRNVSSIIKEIQQTSTNFRVSTLDKEPILDLGDVTTIDKSKRNTSPLPLPKHLGDVVHMDIIFGSNTAINGVKYSLFIVDRATRFKFLYPLKSLKDDILQAIQQFAVDIQCFPKCIRTDFDYKLMGSKIATYAATNHCKIESAPPEHQSQNGVCERNWRTLLKMARSWLASSLLPNKFWYFALKRAAEVSNYLPMKVDNKLTTPHELAYNVKPDLRNIFPLFSVAYVTQTDDHSYNNQTIRTILVGRSDKSNILQFYHPQTKKTISSARCTLDEALVAGPTFGLPYEGGLYVNKYCESTNINKAPTYKPQQKVKVNIKNKSYNAYVIAIPAFDDTIYTLQLEDGSIHQFEENIISELTEQKENPKTHQWIKHMAPITLFLDTMKKPQRGKLLQEEQKWYFRTGYKDSNPKIELPDFQNQCSQYIMNGSLYKGHVSIQQVLLNKSSKTLSKIIANHVSAKGLESHDVPTLLSHKNMSPNDRKIWDAAYAEEYFGLHDLPAWTTLTEAEYQQNKTEYKTILPTMAISTIKHDEFGRPKRAKYRIVALGNLDPHDWTKPDCYAPVMSMLELRLMISIAIKFKRILKSGDFKQAFVQALLPPEEQYVLRPPIGCPHTEKNTYWKLQRTLYGLKRSPRHWYEKAIQILSKMGLQQCPNAPCLFTGTILPGKPPLYLGLYVDDFIFFSESDEVEQHFEKELQKATQVDFMGNVTHFLGLRFQWRKTHTDLKVHISQEAFSDNLIQQAGLSTISAKTNLTPFRSGNPVDSIENNNEYDPTLEKEMRSYVGSLLWLSIGTRPDLSTITNILAQYQNRPTRKHIAAAKYAIRYLKGTKELGLTFSSEGQSNDKIDGFLNFPVNTPSMSALTDANWGPQDQSIPKSNKILPKLDLFKTRSISGYVLTLHGPIHWQSKRQTITARSSAEAEIYATDECVKQLLYIRNIIKDLGLEKHLLKKKTKIYNDNMACVIWTSNKTSKGLRYIQIRENATRENKHLFDIQHISGKLNIADIFSKEVKDAQQFITMRNTIVTPPFPPNKLDYHDVGQTCDTNSSNINDTQPTSNNPQNEDLNFHVEEHNRKTTAPYESLINQIKSKHQMSTNTSNSTQSNKTSNNVNLIKSKIPDKSEHNMHEKLHQKETSHMNPNGNPLNNHENETMIRPEDIQEKKTLIPVNTPFSGTHFQSKLENNINASKTYHPRKYESIKLNSKAQCVSFSLDKISYHPIPSSKGTNEIFTYKDALTSSRAFQPNLKLHDKSRKMWNTSSILKRSSRLAA